MNDVITYIMTAMHAYPSILLTSMLSTGYLTYYSLQPIRIRRVWHYPFPWLQTHPPEYLDLP